MARRPLPALASSAPVLPCVSCLTPFEARHGSQEDASARIWLSEESQVRLRNAQSRVGVALAPAIAAKPLVEGFQPLGFRE